MAEIDEEAAHGPAGGQTQGVFLCLDLQRLEVLEATGQQKADHSRRGPECQAGSQGPEGLSGAVPGWQGAEMVFHVLKELPTVPVAVFRKFLIECRRCHPHAAVRIVREEERDLGDSR